MIILLFQSCLNPIKYYFNMIGAKLMFRCLFAHKAVCFPLLTCDLTVCCFIGCCIEKSFIFIPFGMSTCTHFHPTNLRDVLNSLAFCPSTTQDSYGYATFKLICSSHTWAKRVICILIQPSSTRVSLRKYDSEQSYAINLTLFRKRLL